MRVRFVTVAEPNRRFSEMALLWAWSLRRRGGRLANARATIVFNDHELPAVSQRLRDESDVEVRVMPRLSHTHLEQNKFNAFMLDDFEDDEWVVLTDVDMCTCADLDGLADVLEADEFDLGVTPAGISPRTPLPLVRGLDVLLRRHAGATKADLDALVHPWFTEHAPRSRWPYLSGGIIAVTGRHVREFADEVIRLTAVINRELQPVQANPIRMAVNQWNCRVHRLGWWAESLILGFWFMPRLADQAAITAAMMRLGLRPGYFDHTYNWRYPGSGHGEELPVRLLHYYGSLASAAQADLLEGDWDEGYAEDPNPGRQALADVVRDYRRDPNTGGAVHVPA